jgi:hypothetical protein
MSSAFAKVEIFTWRRDIHHKEEVEKLRKEAKEQEQSCIQLRSSIDSSKFLRTEAEALFADCTNQLIAAKKYLNVLVHCEQQNWDFHDMQNQLVNDSVYGIAKSYGLSSLVQKSHFPSIFNFRETSILDMFENYNTLLDGYEEYISAGIDRAKEQDLQIRSDSDVNWLGKIVEARADKDPSLQLREEMERLTDFTNIYDKGVTEAGLHCLTELHEELNAFYQALGEMIEAKEVDLGVLASLIEQTNRMEAYWAIWKEL